MQAKRPLLRLLALAALAVAGCGAPCTPTDPPGSVEGSYLIDGNPLPQSPEITSSMVLDWLHPVESGAVYANVDWLYRDEFNFVLYEAEEYRGQSLSEVGLRIGFRFGDNNNQDISVFGRNIFDRTENIYTIDFQLGEIGYRQGLDIRFEVGQTLFIVTTYPAVKEQPKVPGQERIKEIHTFRQVGVEEPGDRGFITLRDEFEPGIRHALRIEIQPDIDLLKRFAGYDLLPATAHQLRVAGPTHPCANTCFRPGNSEQGIRVALGPGGPLVEMLVAVEYFKQHADRALNSD